MKKLIISALAGIALLTACTVNKPADQFAPSASMAEKSGTPINELGEGHAIFLKHCSQCHEQRVPNYISSEEWHVVVPGMAWNAGLSKREEDLVNKYLAAASKVE
ncbi:hypothetical protein [Rubritalea squalenifaciens]|uniref:hypothetical protein n=1 Tax=Rubritalea squalenifaciens TaxID=407226 RepID=UPI001161222B|nr:hypothetical protein [Rubritalea squalenifaciens]